VLTGHCVGGKDRTGRLWVVVRVNIIEGVELVVLLPRTEDDAQRRAKRGSSCWAMRPEDNINVFL
jgi:hypothetical protein